MQNERFKIYKRVHDIDQRRRRKTALWIAVAAIIFTILSIYAMVKIF